MRPTFLGFEAAKTGVFASQKALDIVGHNLSNVHTEGYTRQRADLKAQAVDATSTRLRQDLTSLAGMGVNVNGIAQLRNKTLDNAYRLESANAGYYDQNATMLSDIERIINELEVGEDGNGYGLSFAVKELFASLQDFTYNASSETDANVFANAVLNVTQTLNKTYKGLSDSQAQFKTDMQIEVDEVNAMFKDLANLNESIRKTLSCGEYTEQYGPNELLDERNLILDKLSEYGVLRVEENTNGTVTVEMNGHKCVWGDECDTIIYQENSDDTVQLNWKTTGENVCKDTGHFKAATDILNGRGIAASASTESTVNGYLYYKDKLDAFAAKLSDVLNSTIPDEYDEDGNIKSYKTLVGESEETSDGYEVYPYKTATAANITITRQLANDSAYLIDKNKSTDNTFLLELVNRLTSDTQVFSTQSDKFTGTFQEFVADFTGTLGSDLAYAEGRYDNSMKMLSEIQDNRDEISGVSESEETVNMMTYNRAYQAAARMMTVMDDLLDVLINRMAV